MHKHEAQGSSQTKVITRDAGKLRALADLIRNDGFAMSFQSVKQYREALLKTISSVMPQTKAPAIESPMQQRDDKGGAAKGRTSVKRR